MWWDCTVRNCPGWNGNRWQGVKNCVCRRRTTKALIYNTVEPESTCRRELEWLLLHSAQPCSKLKQRITALTSRDAMHTSYQTLNVWTRIANDAYLSIIVCYMKYHRNNKKFKAHPTKEQILMDLIWFKKQQQKQKPMGISVVVPQENGNRSTSRSI